LHSRGRCRPAAAARRSSSLFCCPVPPREDQTSTTVPARCGLFCSSAFLRFHQRWLADVRRNGSRNLFAAPRDAVRAGAFSATATSFKSFERMERVVPPSPPWRAWRLLHWMGLHGALRSVQCVRPTASRAPQIGRDATSGARAPSGGQRLGESTMNECSPGAAPASRYNSHDPHRSHRGREPH